MAGRILFGGFRSNPGPTRSRSAFGAILFLTCAIVSPARADTPYLISPSDCLQEQREMQAQGLAGDIERQLNEPAGVSSSEFELYLEAFRAGLNASRRAGDPQGIASYRLSICAFEVATLRSKMRSQSMQAMNSPADGERVSPKTSAPAPVMTNSNSPQTGGFVAPPKPPRQ